MRRATVAVSLFLLIALPALGSESPLAGRIDAVQKSAEAGDRAGFHVALRTLSEAMLTMLPDRDPAGDVIHVYVDLDRVWTYFIEAPDGAFFSDTSPMHELMARYPAFPAAIEHTVLRLGGVTMYPTRETRDFLVREAARRIAAARTAAK